MRRIWHWMNQRKQSAILPPPKKKKNKEKNGKKQQPTYDFELREVRRLTAGERHDRAFTTSSRQSAVAPTKRTERVKKSGAKKTANRSLLPKIKAYRFKGQEPWTRACCCRPAAKVKPPSQ